MADSADRLAAAIREVIDDAVRAAAARTRPLPELPKPVNDREADIEWPADRMLDPLNEVQQKLGVSRTTVYQLVGDGQLPTVKIGRRRFVTAALDTFVEGLARG